MKLIVNTIFWKDGSKTCLKLSEDDTDALNKTFVEMSSKMLDVVHQLDTPVQVHIKMSEIKMIWEGGKPFWQVN